VPTVESVATDGDALRTELLELRDEVRRDRELNVVAHVSHRETDDQV
jgi:hypothetical protein